MRTTDLQLALGRSGVDGHAVTQGVPLGPSRPHILSLLHRLYQQRMDALAMYLPLPHAEAFHADTTKWRLAIGSNRGGKSLTCDAEYARLVLGCDPYNKLQPTGGTALVVGKDRDHLALMWRTMAEPGAFYVINDEHSGLPRAVRPHPLDPTRLDDYDEASREKWRPAPPLIPWQGSTGRVTKIAWEDAARGIPRAVTYDTGWTALWRSSEGKAPQGEHWTLFLADEEMMNTAFYEEAARGLVGLNEPEHWRPKAIWSATDQDAVPQLAELCRGAEANLGHVQSFFFDLSHNPYIPQTEREIFYASLTEDQREFRFFGNSRSKSRRCYQMYDAQGIHGCEESDVPEHGTNYIYVDPGNTMCGTLFLRVDPMNKHRWIWGGFQMPLPKGLTCQHWARLVKEKLGDTVIYGATIDKRAGGARQLGGGITTAKLWWDALMRAGVHVHTEGGFAGSGFYQGCDDIEARQTALQNWLLPRETGDWAGLPLLKKVRGVFPELDEQIIKARIVSVKRTIKARRSERRALLPEDALVTLEYAAAADPCYRPIALAPQAKHNRVYEMYEQITRKHSTGRQGCLVG